MRRFSAADYRACRAGELFSGMAMKRFVIALSMIVCAVGASNAAQADEVGCRNMYESTHADVDGPVLSVTDHGAPLAVEARYHIVVRDRFTGCRISGSTNSLCKVGQHASIVGGSFGLWTGDNKDADSDYPYLNSHIWTCE
jgi:hypothetical protein